jgi:two-component system response regulator AtoC
MNAFLSYDWPGNVRELENIIKKIVVLENEEFALKDLGLSSRLGVALQSASASPSSSGRISLKKAGKMAAQEAEKELILGTLMETRWNRKKAAGLLDISYKALLYKMKQAGLNKKRFVPLT